MGIDDSIPRGPDLILGGHQKALLEALQKLDNEHIHSFSLAKIYYGAIRSLADKQNPEYLATTAHCLRELVEKLPLSLDIPIPHQSGNMGYEANNLRDLWEKAVSNSKAFSNNEWNGDIDGPLKKYLTGSVAFFNWLIQNRPSRTERPRQVVRKLDPSQHTMPRVLEDAEVKTWVKFHEHFEGIAHHQPMKTDDFHSWVYHFERFMLDRLRPRIFDDQAELDQIIE